MVLPNKSCKDTTKTPSFKNVPIGVKPNNIIMTYEITELDKEYLWLPANLI